jgi:hypothetical protein
MTSEISPPCGPHDVFAPPYNESATTIHLPMYLKRRTWPLMNAPLSDSPLSVEQLNALSPDQLGAQIVARVEARDVAEAQVHNNSMQAGQMLLHAKSTVKNFSQFRRQHCNGLSHSRAYELMNIAKCGSIRKVRELANGRKSRYRLKKAAMAAERQLVRSGTDKPSAPEALDDTLLAQFKAAIDDLFSRMDKDTRRAALDYAMSWSIISKSAVIGFPIEDIE